MTHAERFERRKAIAEAATRGSGLSELCCKFSVSSHTVYTACREYAAMIPVDVDVSVLGKRHPFEVLAKLKGPDNPTCAQVARDCGLTGSRVRQIKAHARELRLL